MEGLPEETAHVAVPVETFKCFGKRCARPQLEFFAQTFLLYIVVIASIVNITCTERNTTLWVTLLSSSVGYLLPHPKFRGEKLRARPLSQLKPHVP